MDPLDLIPTQEDLEAIQTEPTPARVALPPAIQAALSSTEQTELTPTQVAQQRTKEYLGGPWYKRLLTGLAEGMKATGKDYETPYDKFFKQALSEYQAETPRKVSEDRIRMAEETLRQRTDQFEQNLALMTKKHEAQNRISQARLDLERIKNDKQADINERKIRIDEMLRGLEGEAGLQVLQTQDPKLKEAIAALRTEAQATKALIEADSKLASTQDQRGTPPRVQVVRGEDLGTGKPSLMNVFVPGSPGVSRADVRDAARNRLESRANSSQQPSATNPLLQSFGQYRSTPTAVSPQTAPAQRPAVNGSSAVSRAVTAATPGVSEPFANSRPIPQEAIKLGQVTSYMPSMDLPKALQPGDIPATAAQGKAYRSKIESIEQGNEVAGMLIDLYIKGQLNDISGPLAGSPPAKKLREWGMLDPSTGQIAISNAFLDQWKKKMYSETGMQANQVELATSQEYFAKLGNSPEANLKKAIYMNLTQRAMLEKMKLPGALYKTRLVNLGDGLIDRTNKIVDSLKKGYAFDPRDFNMQPFVWERFGVNQKSKPVVGPKQSLSQELGLP